MKTTLAILLLSIFSCQSPPQKEPAAISFDKIILRKTNGSLLDPASLAGKKIFLNFWATWCKPCIAEMPSIARAREKLASDSISFVFASSETASEIEAFAKEQSLPFHFVIVENMESLSINAIPSTWIFDSHGILEFSATGSREWDEKANIEIIKRRIP